MLRCVSLSFVGGPILFTSVSRLKKVIKEISNTSLPVAQQKLASSLRKRIKRIKNRSKNDDV